LPPSDFRQLFCASQNRIPSSRLLLRPDSIDASDSPQMAMGYVTHLAFDLARVSLEQFRDGTHK